MHPAFVAFETNAVGLSTVVAEDHARAVLGEDVHSPSDRRVRQALSGEDCGAFELDRSLSKHRRTPQGAVDVVYSPRSDPADAVVVNEIPIVAALDIVVRRRGGRPEPHLVVQPVRYRGRLGHGQAASAGHAHFDGVELSKIAVQCQLRSETEVAVRTLLCAQLEHSGVTPHRVAHRLAFVDGQRHAFLAVNILAVPHGPHRVQRVPELGRGNGHGINVVARGQVAEVAVRVAAFVGARTGFFGVAVVGPLLGALAFRLEWIANSHDLRGRIAQEPAQNPATPSPNADMARPNAIVGRRPAVGAQHRSWHEARCRNGRPRRSEKPTARPAPHGRDTIAPITRNRLAHLWMSFLLVTRRQHG